MGVLRRPELRVIDADFSDAVLQWITRAVQKDFAFGYAVHRDVRAAERGFDTDILNVPCRHALQPHRLPDAGDGGVPHAAALFLLLAPGQDMPVQLAAYLHFQRVFCLQAFCDVEGKGLVAAGMFPDAAAVEKDLRKLVYCAEVQQYPAAHEALRQDEFLPVEKGMALGKVLPDAGQDSFRRKGYADFPVIEGFAVRRCAEIPLSVQIEEGSSAQQGAGIFRPRLAGERACFGGQ